ncbi:MAG: alpha/beta hydrolase [Planctomycetia bacterium]|nr:alpha/beta hydrolase [Planctomycetia bacterium]
MAQVRRLSMVAAAGALALCLAAPLSWGQEERKSPPAKFDTILNVAYAERDGKPLLADVLVPTGEGPFPAVLVIHGGAWRSGSKAQLRFIGRLLAERGYVAVMINYRLAPDHIFPAQFDDCRAALEWMRKEGSARHKIDPKWIAAWGYSAGGHLSALLAMRESAASATSAGGNGDGNGNSGGNGGGKAIPPHGLAAFVAGGAPCDFRSLPPNVRFLEFWLGGTRQEKPQNYIEASPCHYVGKSTPPGFFYHGGDDELVALRDPQKLAAQMKTLGVPVQMKVLAKKGHIMAAVDVDAVRAGMDFLDEVRKTGKAETRLPD